MKGHEEVIEALNAGLTIELTAINQYFIQSKMCANWGLNRLADHFYKESIEEMKHAEEVIDRILYLDGVPEIARYDVIKVGSTAKEQIENSLKNKEAKINELNTTIDTLNKQSLGNVSCNQSVLTITDMRFSIIIQLFN